MLGFLLRPARRSDSRAIALLFLMSSDGLAEYIWSCLAAGDGEQPLDIGARRYARDGVAFSWQNCLVAERGGKIVGMMHAFPMEAPAPDAAPESDPVLRPYSELEDSGSLYISGVAVEPECRGAGVGAALMEAAELRAAALGLPRVSLICFEANAVAFDLYRRRGFREIARRAIVPHPSLHYSDGAAILLVKSIKPDMARPPVALADTDAPWHSRARPEPGVTVLRTAA
jgi:ribosomal protein S18 acetylase RimI-like enzyme